MRTRNLAALGTAVFLVVGASSGCTTLEHRSDAPGTHVHGDAGGASAEGGTMGAHMREMEGAIREARSILERTQGLTDPAKLRTALDEVGAQLDAMQSSMTRCKSMMQHGEK
jgi:hypothetical protein